MTQDEYIKLRAFAIATGNTENFVILKEDEQGRYIDYAFKEGSPHDNRRLSRYDSFQPNALTRDEHEFEYRKETYMHPVGKIYELGMFSCGHENHEGDEHCSPGHPCEKCPETHAGHWTYDEPVKCACRFLKTVDSDDKYLMTPDQALTFAQIVQNEVLSQ